ncbi:MAG TPA: acyltransferase family protein [Xanthomonadales bacterium]|nr:acyltransferase family protein [Xanthomonadales bacterium]
MSQEPKTRRYDIDALRVFAFALLILYHVGMFYVPWDWHVKSQYQSTSLETLMLIVNQWRMPLIFLISGLAVHFLLDKVSPAVFAGRRIVRLGLPLVFGMLVIVPPQPYYEALANGAFDGSYIEFLKAYFTFQPWPEGAFAGWDYGITWNHLWYLPYLLCYTLVGLPLFLWLRNGGSGVTKMLRQARGPWLVLLPVIPLFLAGWFVYPRFPYISHSLIDDWYGHAMYGTIFLYGYIIGRDPGIWSEMARIRRWTLGLAIVAFPGFRLISGWAGEDPSAVQNFALFSAVYLNRWLWLLAILGWGYRLLNRPYRWLPYATEAVYPWYILHQSITVVAGYQLSRLALGPVVEPILLISITIGGCLVLHEFVVRRVSWLRPLFGLKSKTTADKPLQLKANYSGSK